MAVSGLIVRALGGGAASTIPLLILRGLNAGGAPPVLPISANGVVPCWYATHDKQGLVPVIFVPANNPNGSVPIRIVPEGPNVVPIQVVTTHPNGVMPVTEYQ